MSKHTIDIKCLGETIRLRRAMLDISLSEFARRVGISKGYLHQIENKGAEIGITTMAAISRELSLTIDDLLEDCNE